MKIILCFVFLSGLVALVCAAPDDKADAAKAAADAAKSKKEPEEAAKKVAADAAKNVKDAAGAAVKAATDGADKAKEEAKRTEKEAEKDAEDCVHPDGGGHKHPGPISAIIKTAEKAVDTMANLIEAGFSFWSL